MQDISKISLVFPTNFTKSIKYGVACILVTTLFLFLSALLGLLLKRRARDHCLKRLDRSKVILPYGTGDWQAGEVRILLKGLS